MSIIRKRSKRRGVPSIRKIKKRRTPSFRVKLTVMDLLTMKSSPNFL